MGSSFTTRYQIDANNNVVVHVSNTWTDLVVQLDAAATGDTKLGLNGTPQFVLNPGTPVRIMICPNTEVKVETNSGLPVEVCVLITELDWIEEIQRCLQGVGNMAAVAAGLMKPVIAVGR